MPVFKSGNQEQFLIKVLEPLASNCLLPQDCKCVKDETRVLFNWLTPEPGTMPAQGLHAVVS